MPNFANPFQGNVDRKLTNAELMQALRLDIAGELEAIFLYDAHYLATDDPGPPPADHRADSLRLCAEGA